MEATSDAEATEGHLRKLPTDLRKQVEEVNALVDLPVEGYYIWLKYVVSNIFRVAELNKVLSLLMSRTKARVPSLGSMSKRDKLTYLLQKLALDPRCYMSMKDGAPNSENFLVTSPLTSRLEEAVNPDIHPGFIIKLVYYQVMKVGGFRYSYHNQMLRKDMVDAMGPLDPGQYSLALLRQGKNTAALVRSFSGVRNDSVKFRVSKSAGSPLKLRIKREAMEKTSMNAQLGSAFGEESGAAGPGPSSSAPAAIVVDCICGNNSVPAGAAFLPQNPMLQCKNCGVWQHVKCIMGAGKDKSPKVKMCFKCRVLMADPFYIPSPTLQLSQYYAVTREGGQNEHMYRKNVCTYRRGFMLDDKAYRALFSAAPKKVYLGLACLLVEDKIQNRIHLPKSADVTFNGRNVKIYNRCSNKDLSDNTRDMIVDISAYAHRGLNTITMCTRDTRNFVMIVQLYEDENLENVKRHMKRQPELRDELVKRVKGLFKMRGSELGFSSIQMSLICPLGGTRMKVPVKSDACKHQKCFDLDPFLKAAQKTKKWQCPHCRKAIQICDLEEDQYVKKILELNGSVECIELNDEGKWRPYNGKDGPYFDFDVPAPLEEEESESEEIDEEEEMRRAAGELEAQGIKKRPRPEPEVVSLLSSDEEDEVIVPGQRFGDRNPSIHEQEDELWRLATQVTAIPGLAAPSRIQYGDLPCSPYGTPAQPYGNWVPPHARKPRTVVHRTPGVPQTRIATPATVTTTPRTVTTTTTTTTTVIELD
ncbi:E3 SUMO-protein ligase [Chloropicon primus]|uniref:E3 SUMO-protein ligase n=1 Tax=Chloropicon primus TaxID=1764295 RepID=A0A5B8MRV0_9CHLO|nr:E3 SUMO-protein ligase [Chloropicon primus]|eukprot:QDZ22644.1 E3 SUMO-protein ligase [Chloropicon primus]